MGAKDRNMVYLSCPSGVDASSGDIGRTIDFRYAKLENMKFDGANLEKAKFDYAVCKGCSFVGAEMSGADMSFAKMDDSNFSGAGQPRQRGPQPRRVQWGHRLPECDLLWRDLRFYDVPEREIRGRFPGGLRPERKLRGVAPRPDRAQRSL